MIADGDFDTLAPFYRMFLHALPLAQSRTEIYYHHHGAIFPKRSFSGVCRTTTTSDGEIPKTI
jgi:hypothetical protein